MAPERRSTVASAPAVGDDIVNDGPDPVTIPQVIIDVSRMITPGVERRGGQFLGWVTLSGVGTGMGVMYLTALLVVG